MTFKYVDGYTAVLQGYYQGNGNTHCWCEGEVECECDFSTTQLLIEVVGNPVTAPASEASYRLYLRHGRAMRGADVRPSTLEVEREFVIDSTSQGEHRYTCKMFLESFHDFWITYNPKFRSPNNICAYKSTVTKFIKDMCDWEDINDKYKQEVSCAHAGAKKPKKKR
jgi:hypothetical protein